MSVESWYTTQENSRTCHPKICHFGIPVILSCKEMQEKAVSELLLSIQRQSLQKHFSCNMPSQEFHQQEKNQLSSKERRLEVNTTLSHIIVALLCFSKDLFISLQNYSPPTLLRCYLNPNSRPPERVPHFSLGISYIY